MGYEEKMTGFRNADVNAYPELKGYSKKQIYDGFIGCGGLYLTSRMVRLMNLKKDGVILNLGCGLGSGAVFLAKKFDATIISVDFWSSSQLLSEKAYEEEVQNKIIPLKFDITKIMPFAENYFDAIFCMNSMFMFGGDSDFLKRLLGTLKKGGTLCVGSECFNREPDNNATHETYNFNWDWNIWDGHCSNYHSPDWWHSLIDSTEMVDIEYCQELDEGRILFEDYVLNYQEYVDRNAIDTETVVPQDKLVEQIRYGVEFGLHPTLYILKGIKK